MQHMQDWWSLNAAQVVDLQETHLNVIVPTWLIATNYCVYEQNVVRMYRYIRLKICASAMQAT